MIEDAINPMNSLEDDSSVTSNSYMGNNLDCITEFTYGENGSIMNSYVRMNKRRYTTHMTMNDGEFTYDDETIPSELSYCSEKQSSVYDCLGVEHNNA